jgi:hypothetical protein
LQPITTLAEALNLEKTAFDTYILTLIEAYSRKGEDTKVVQFTWINDDNQTIELIEQ